MTAFADDFDDDDSVPDDDCIYPDAWSPTADLGVVFADDTATFAAGDVDLPPKRPWLCPHCGRDRHPGPLTGRAARMIDDMVFEANYDAERDESPVVCVGADFQGPPTAAPVLPSSLVQVIGKPFLEQLSDMLPSIKSAFESFSDHLKQLVSDMSLPTVTYKLWLPGDDDPPPQCELPDALPNITFGPPFGPPFTTEQFYPGTPLAARLAVTQWWPHILKANNEIPLPTPPDRSDELIAAVNQQLNNNHHPAEGNHYEGQRIPRRGPRRTRRPLDQGNNAQQRRRSVLPRGD